MPDIYIHNRIHCSPRRWSTVAEGILTLQHFDIRNEKSSLYGIWRSQIGLPRDTITVISSWPNEKIAKAIAPRAFDKLEFIESIETSFMTPSVRPTTHDRPKRQGNYAFRWFDTPKSHFDEFLKLCTEAWPNFERKYDSQIIGLWTIRHDQNDLIRTLLITRRPSLAMWERSKIPIGVTETKVREKLNRRYDLCNWTTVHTTTLFTADDIQDTARWS